MDIHETKMGLENSLKSNDRIRSFVVGVGFLTLGEVLSPLLLTYIFLRNDEEHVPETLRMRTTRDLGREIVEYAKWIGKEGFGLMYQGLTGRTSEYTKELADALNR